MAHWPAVASTNLRPRRPKPTIGREDVGAQEGKEQFGATVVRRDRENQCATECLRARGFDLDPIFEHHTGPRHDHVAYAAGYMSAPVIPPKFRGVRK